MENTSLRDPMSSETFIGPSAGGTRRTGPIVGPSLADCNGYAVRAPDRRCLPSSLGYEWRQNQVRPAGRNKDDARSGRIGSENRLPESVGKRAEVRGQGG